MIAIACYIAVAGISVAILLSAWRLAIGPHTLDRVLALDTLVINVIALVVVIGILYTTTMYFEVGMLFAMVGFLSTVAFCKYKLRGNVIE
jgi:multicomponent K+:H+ antiporter subunit F